MDKNCIYCEDQRPSNHFECEKCGAGMCDECYDLITEHDYHFHRICEGCEDDLYEAIVKEIGHEPDYLCKKCVSEISKKYKK